MKEYTTKEVLKKLRISRNTLLNWFRQGKVSDVEKRNRNGYRIFTEQDVKRLLAYKNRTVENTAWGAKNRKKSILGRMFFSMLVLLCASWFLPVLYVPADGEELTEQYGLAADLLFSGNTMETRVFDVSGGQPSEMPVENDYDGEDVSAIEKPDINIPDVPDTEELIPSDIYACSDKEEGVIPFSVSFSGLGLDEDKDIVMYKWNFHGGTGFDTFSRESGDGAYTYRQAGFFMPTFSAVDGEGYTDTYCMMMNSRAGRNAPSVEVEANVYHGTAPLEVMLSGTGVSSAGRIVRYEWDFDGDGAYDWSSAYGPAVVHRYTRGGFYPAVLRVTDNAALISTGTVYIFVSDDDNPPVMTARVNDDSGVCPLEVFLDISSDDTGIILYQWDFDGDGVFDWESSSAGCAVHTYGQPGVYRAKARILTEDMLSAVDTVEVRVKEAPGSDVPISDFDMSVHEGQAPLEVYFTELVLPGAAEIVRYEWDFNGDGKWDRTVRPYGDLSGNIVDVEHVYGEAGLYKVVLKVTDSAGFSDMQTAFITVTQILPEIPDEPDRDIEGWTRIAGTDPLCVELPEVLDQPVVEEPVLPIGRVQQVEENGSIQDKALCGDMEPETLSRRVIRTIINWLESLIE